MRYLQVSIYTLTGAGCSRPAMANSFFPATDQNNHIHFGTPTGYQDGTTRRTAEDGNIYMTYISFKKDGVFWFRLNHNPSDGYFSFPGGRSINDLPATWQAVIRRIGTVR